MTTHAFDIPEEDAREFAGLPTKVRDRVRWLLQVMRSVASVPKGKVKACEDIAKAARMHRNSIYNVWKRYETSGDWRVLIDRRHTSEFWQRDDSKRVGLPHEFVQEWKRRCEENQRAFKPAHRILIQDWKAWRAGDLTKAIPGYLKAPDPAPGSKVPHGWNYSNLLNHVPTDVELAAARQGREAARLLLPGVRTTRVGSYPFAEIQFDDMWHDFEVNVPGQKTSCRLLEFGSVEAFSTFIFRPGLKPRLRNADTGKMQALNERDFHLYLVNWLLDYGVHPDGTVFNVENGTAAIRRDFEEKLLVWFRERLTVTRSGMSGAPAYPGSWKERAKGNFRAKSLKEGLGKLIHNQLAHLPGQVGMHRNNLPATHDGRSKDNELLLALVSQVPALAGKLQLGFLDLQEAVFAIHQVYDLLNCRNDHQIEGWDQAGMVIDQFRFSKQSDDWRPFEDVTALPAHEQQLLASTLRLDPSLRRRHHMSPAECVLAHRTRLIRPPHEAIPDLLGPEYGEVREVRNGTIAFTRPDVGRLRYKAFYQDSGGFRRRLDNGTEYLCHLNPWKPEFLYISESRTGRFLGRAAIDRTPTRGDVEAIHHAWGEAQRDYKDAIRETAVRHGLGRLPHLQQNTAALRKTAAPSARDQALAATFDSATMLDQFDPSDRSHHPDPATAFDPADLL